MGKIISEIPMQQLQLRANLRNVKATDPNKLRKLGQLPAVLYGHKVKNASLTLDAREFEKIFRKAGESTIVELATDDGKTHPVLIHEVQHHHLTSVPIHVDFYEVSMTEKLKTKVALDFVGESKAQKELGGVLMRNLNEVEVQCLPSDLPHSLTVDISALVDFTSAILVKDLVVSDKVKILTPADEVVAKVQPPRDVEAELAAPVVEDVTKVEGVAEEQPATGEAIAPETSKTPKTKEPEKPLTKPKET